MKNEPVKLDQLQMVVATPSIYGLDEKTLATQMNRIRYMIRRIDSVCRDLLCIKTIRHSFQILHSSSTNSFRTTNIFLEELMNFAVSCEVSFLSQNNPINSEIVEQSITKYDLKILIMITDEGVEPTSVIKKISGVAMTAFDTKHLEPGQSFVWYPMCKGFEYFTWNGMKLLLKS